MSKFDYENFLKKIKEFDEMKDNQQSKLARWREETRKIMKENTDKKEKEACEHLLSYYRKLSELLIDMGSSSGFMMDFSDCVEESYWFVKSDDQELYNDCVNQAMLALNQFLILIAKTSKTAKKFSGDIDVPYEILKVCFEDSLKFLNDFGSSLELRPRHKLQAATDGFTYLNTVISALNDYDDKIKKFTTPDIINRAGITLNATVEEANKSIKNSEINQQRGFKMLTAWFTSLFLSFEWCKDLKKPETKSYGHLFTVGDSVVTAMSKFIKQDAAVPNDNEVGDDVGSQGEFVLKSLPL